MPDSIIIGMFNDHPAVLDSGVKTCVPTVGWYDDKAMWVVALGHWMGGLSVECGPGPLGMMRAVAVAVALQRIPGCAVDMYDARNSDRADAFLWGRYCGYATPQFEDARHATVTKLVARLIELDHADLAQALSESAAIALELGILAVFSVVSLSANDSSPAGAEEAPDDA